MTSLQKKIMQTRLIALASYIAILGLCFWPLIALAVDPPASQPAAAAAAAPAAAPAVAPVATAPAQQTWWNALLIPILGALGTGIALFIGLGLRKLTQLLEVKFKIDIPDQVEALMAEKAKQLVAWGEEQMEKRLLHGDGQPTPGAQTITQVKDALWKFADGLGYGKQYTEDKLTQLIEGILHLNRAGSDGVIGSTGERAAALVAKTNGNK